MTSPYRRALTAKLHILLKEQGAEDQKEAIYSGYGVTSSKELSDDQLADLVEKLDISSRQNNPRLIMRSPGGNTVKTFRSEILKLITGSPGARDPRKRGLGVPNDWDILNPFIKHHTGKFLPYLSQNELEKFQRKLFAMRESDWYYGKKDEQAEQQEQNRYAAQQIFDFQMPAADSPVS